MATGAYVRIDRGGKYQSLEIDELTDEELEQFATIRPDAGWIWAKFLVKWIRDNINEEER